MVSPESQEQIVETESRLEKVARFITLARLAWHQESLDEMEASDHVIRNAPEGARIIRGFSTPIETPDVATVTPVERINAHHRRGQVRKIEKANIERYRLSQVYGVSVTEEQVPSPSPSRAVSSSGSIDSQRWEKNRSKIEAADRGMTASFDTPERSRRSHKRATEKAAKLQKRKTSLIQRRNDRLDKAAEGRTVPARIRSWRIARKQDKIAKLQDKLENA